MNPRKAGSGSDKSSRQAVSAMPPIDVMGPLAQHPVADLFSAEFDFAGSRQSADILRRRLGQPVVLHDGMVLEGGDRLRAAFAQGFTPRFETYDGAETLAYVLSLRFERINYSPGQRAAIVAYLQDWSAAPGHGGVRKTQVAMLQLVTCRDRARRANVSERTQASADKVAKADTSLLLEVIAGNVSLEQAEARIDANARGDDAPKRDLHKKCKAEFNALQAQFAKLNVITNYPPTAPDQEAELSRLRLALAKREAEVIALTSQLAIFSHRNATLPARLREIDGDRI